MTTYKIIRMRNNGSKRVIKRGLTLDEAQEYCRNPDSSGISGDSAKVRAISKRLGTSLWFCGYESE